MADKPVFSWTPRLGAGVVTTANTGRDGTGAVVELLAGVGASANGPGGTKVFRITAQARVATTAGMVRIFVSLDGGTTKLLRYEFAVTATSADADTPAWSGSVAFDDFVLPDTNAKLYASTEQSEAICVFVDAGDLTG